MKPRLTLEQRLAIVRAAMPWLADRPDHRLSVECMDISIVLEGGNPPGMTLETRMRVLEEAKKQREQRP